MAYFSQWRRAADEGRFKRVTYVCGTQRVLIEEVIDFLRAQSKADVDEVINVTLNMSERIPESEVWRELNQYPLTHTMGRFILIRDVQLIKDWQPFIEWLNEARDFPTVYVVLVGTDPKLDTDQPWQAHLQKRGAVVYCPLPNGDDLVKWVQVRVPCTAMVAQRLIVRCSADMSRMSSVCMKLALFDGEPTEDTVDALCSEAPGDDFEMSLIARDKRRALTALDAMAVDEYGMMVGLLVSRLVVLAKLNEYVTNRMGLKDIAMKGEVDKYLVSKFIEYAKGYDPKRVTEIRKMMVVVDDAMRGDEGRPRVAVGAMQALVAGW